MARLVTLATLRSDAKILANQRSAAFLTDPEWDRMINLACTELYDLQVAARGHEAFEKTANLATTSGSAIVALPADWYETITLIANWGAQQLEELNDLGHLGDQVDFRNWNQWAFLSPKAWRQRGPLIEFFPTPSAVTALELRYVPAFQDLSGDTATIDGSNGWDELISCAAAIKALTIQAMPSGGVSEIYARVRARIEELAEQRAAANAPTIRDVKFRDRNYWDRRGRLPPPP